MTTIKSGWSVAGDLIVDIPETTQTESGSILIHPEVPDDASREQWMRLAETSTGFEFCNDPGEDIYSENDGEPA